jgi:hypothetical protein
VAVQLIHCSTHNCGVCPRCNRSIPAQLLPQLKVHKRLATLVRLLLQYSVSPDALQWSNSIGALVGSSDGVELYRGVLLCHMSILHVLWKLLHNTIRHESNLEIKICIAAVQVVA